MDIKYYRKAVFSIINTFVHIFSILSFCFILFISIIEFLVHSSSKVILSMILILIYYDYFYFQLILNFGLKIIVLTFCK